MKKSAIIVLIACFVLPLAAQEEMGEKALRATDDRSAIKAAVLDYLEGWYEGNPDRMERALHPDLAKRQVVQIPNTGKTILNYASCSAMVEYTRAGFGKLDPDKRNIKIEIQDIYRDIAQVKAVSAKFVDYCQVAKCNGKWKIVHVLWMPVVKGQKGEAPKKRDEENR